MLAWEGGRAIGFVVLHPEDVILAAVVVLKKNRRSDPAAVVSAKNLTINNLTLALCWIKKGISMGIILNYFPRHPTVSYLFFRKQAIHHKSYYNIMHIIIVPVVDFFPCSFKRIFFFH